MKRNYFFLILIAVFSYSASYSQACAVQNCNLQASASAPHVAGPSEVWSALGSCYINQNVVVPAGHHLTINNGTFHFLSDAQITVEPTGRLTVTGSTTVLTGCNANSLWQGIEVRGDISQPSTATHQGYVHVTNGATISQMAQGVHYPNNGMNGGVVIASDANFINNKAVAAFLEYNGGSNSSSFTDCSIIIDAGFVNVASSPSAGNYIIPSQITAWKCDGIRIRGCEFINDFAASGANNPVHYDLLGDAIGVLDASISIDRSAGTMVNPDCPEPLGSMNTFIGWRNAVVSRTSSGNTESLDVVGSTFDNNTNGIFIRGNVEGIIFDNTFRNEQDEYLVIDRVSSLGGGILRKATGIKLIDLRKEVKIYDNTFNFDRTTLNQTTELYGVFFTGNNDYTNLFYPRPEVAYNDFNMTGENPANTTTDYRISAVKIYEYTTFDLELFCNKFDHNGTSYNAMGGSSNVRFSDVFLRETTYSGLNIGGDGFTTCPTGLCGQPGINEWTHISITPCVSNVSNIRVDIGHAQYLSDGSFLDTPNCNDASSTLIAIGSGNECNEPSWCSLFGTSGGGVDPGKRLDENDASDSNVDHSFYPNPANEEVKFSVRTDVTIYALSGQVVLTEKSVDRVNTSNLKSGVYLLETSNGMREKLIIKH